MEPYGLSPLRRSSSSYGHELLAKAGEKGRCCVQEGVRGECPAYDLREAALFGLGLAVLLSPPSGARSEITASEATCLARVL